MSWQRDSARVLDAARAAARPVALAVDLGVARAERARVGDTQRDRGLARRVERQTASTARAEREPNRTERVAAGVA